jgi:ATP-binding cassette subfamily F protein 3
MRPFVRDLLGAFLFSGDDVLKKVKVLSGGERARLSIARLLLEPTNFLVMDEPTNHLDISSKEILKDALLNYTGALILVSHDRDFLQGITEKTIEFTEDGTMEYLGDIDYYLEKRKINDISEIDLEKVPKGNNIDGAKEQSNSQNRRAILKELERDKRKLDKEIDLAEQNIAKLEERKDALDAEFANPEIYDNPEKIATARKEYEELEANILIELDKWSEYSHKLENIMEQIATHHI